jgi:hypothetical protein
VKDSQRRSRLGSFLFNIEVSVNNVQNQLFGLLLRRKVAQDHSMVLAESEV